MKYGHKSFARNREGAGLAPPVAPLNPRPASSESKPFVPRDGAASHKVHVELLWLKDA